MKCEVLIATMNCEDKEKLIRKIGVKDCLIINQVTKSDAPMLEDTVSSNQRILSFREKGLSKSRNKALENATGDICIVADDDLKYVKDYEKIIQEGYEKYPDADIIAFRVDNVDKKLQKAIRREGKENFISIMKIQSVQTTFRRKSILDKDIRFNEMFGAGAELYSGEENIFLSDCIKKKLKIYYIPNKIATIQDNNSTWMNGYNKKYFNTKGAAFYAISKFFYPMLILQFAIRKRKRYKDEIHISQAIQYMHEGVKLYKSALVKDK